MYLLYKVPILTKDGKIFGYEMFVKLKGSCIFFTNGSPNRLNNLINFLIEENINELFKNRKVIIPVDYKELNTELISLLMPENVIFKISINNGVQANLLRDLNFLKKKGFGIILEGFHFNNPSCISFLKKADCISISIKSICNASEIKEFAKTLNKKILLTEIESKEDYIKALEYADLLQGTYIAEPKLFHHYKNYKFLSGFLTRLIKQMRRKNKAELYSIIKGNKNLRKIVELWTKEFYPEQKLDTLELRIIIFLYLVKDIFLTSEGYRYIHHALFRAFLMREFANILVPERSREAFITGLLSCCDEFLEISSVNLARSLEYPDDILEALESLKGHLGYLLSNVYLVEACVFRKEGCEENTYAKLSYLFNRNAEEIKEIVKRAKRKTSKLLTLLRMSEVPGSKDLQQRNKLAQL